MRTRREHGPALVFTVDFIARSSTGPGLRAIAAANAISDVYAMGGEPMVALAVCGFPDDKLGKDVLARIFRGGRDKAAEAGCAIVGGHTVLDPELKYGLAVVGTVDPARALLQTRARVGDRLVLTKPIGTGIAAQAIKSRALSPADIARVTALMSELNREAKNAALAAGAHAATDVTGFGLLGTYAGVGPGSQRACARQPAGARLRARLARPGAGVPSATAWVAPNQFSPDLADHEN
jgi:selenide,water dikinase